MDPFSLSICEFVIQKEYELVFAELGAVVLGPHYAETF